MFLNGLGISSLATRGRESIDGVCFPVDECNTGAHELPITFSPPASTHCHACHSAACQEFAMGLDAEQTELNTSALLREEQEKGSDRCHSGCGCGKTLV